jgi:hypothetical protein
MSEFRDVKVDGDIITGYLETRISAALEEFDRTMAYVNQAIAAERERCAKVAETAYDATAEGREWGYCFAAKIRSES